MQTAVDLASPAGSTASRSNGFAKAGAAVCQVGAEGCRR